MQGLLLACNGSLGLASRLFYADGISASHTKTTKVSVSFRMYGYRVMHPTAVPSQPCWQLEYGVIGMEGK